MNSYQYRAFGLNIQSDWECPELAPGTGQVDVFVRRGQLIHRPDESRFWSRTSRGLRLQVPGVARYQVDDGVEILIDPETSASPESIRLFLLGSAFGALLHQRGILTLHGSAIAADGASVALVGDSGAGKSTTAAALVKTGDRLLTDDVSAIDWSPDNQPRVLPAYPQHKLWEDSMRSLRMDPEHYRRVLPEEGKRAVLVRHDFEARPVHLAGIVLLETGDVAQPVMQQIRGAERLTLIIRHTYRNFFLEEMGLLDSHFRSASRVAAAVPLVRLVRPTSDESLASVVQMIRTWRDSLADCRQAEPART